jgi:hypothetical protein
MPMVWIPSLVRVGAVCAVVLVIAACTPGGNFDPTELVNIDTKKKIPGDREPLFPNGVPGAETGVPPDLVKGYQPPPEPAQAADVVPPPVAAGHVANANAPAAMPEKPKPQFKPKPKPAPKVAATPARQPQHDPIWDKKPPPPQTNWPAPNASGQQPAATTNWPAPPATAAAPQTNWPTPPPASTYSH